ncbi:PREDICTED: uncharacterized protein LOC108569922 isoform X2 [Nicrophorus vespilloides]|uniref:Uncharacterized protein LOC108569922 isoform X2 n=1 Tax=Nicrophorus vespilloides TaxID=110193 RepID=A0ABM1NK29_NICVS|nr:PREDICTED: uncharacterized protein LOC108569922 isoform X2 [Nicrophorus vespilloides]
MAFIYNEQSYCEFNFINRNNDDVKTFNEQTYVPNEEQNKVTIKQEVKEESRNEKRIPQCVAIKKEVLHVDPPANMDDEYEEMLPVEVKEESRNEKRTRKCVAIKKEVLHVDPPANMDDEYEEMLPVEVKKESRNEKRTRKCVAIKKEVLHVDPSVNMDDEYEEMLPVEVKEESRNEKRTRKCVLVTKKKQVLHVDVDPPANTDDEYEEILPVKKFEQRDEEEDKIDDEEMTLTRFGPNGSAIPTEKFNTINWNSRKMATRALMHALFTRNTMATHSMTGCVSNALLDTGRKPKRKLNAEKVDDIVYIVMQKCDVRRADVRRVISQMCCDENKLAKKRGDI